VAGKKEHFGVTARDRILAPLLAQVLLDRISEGQEPFANKTELLETAKDRYPSVAELIAAKPISLGHPLLVISNVVVDLGFVNITSFALSQNTEEVGSGYPDASDPQEDRIRAKAFSWTPEIKQKIISAIEALPVGTPLRY